MQHEQQHVEHDMLQISVLYLLIIECIHMLFHGVKRHTHTCGIILTESHDLRFLMALVRICVDRIESDRLSLRHDIEHEKRVFASLTTSPPLGETR